MNTISIIGGDLRQVTLYNLLIKDGFNVSAYGLDNEFNISSKEKNIDNALKKDIIILPMPMCTADTLNAPFSNEKIKIDDILNKIKFPKIVLGGKIPAYFKHQLEEKGVICIDYLEREELAIKNAVPTAEGAIEIAIHETPFTLHSSNCLILGYGKIGKVLADMLSSIGSHVTVAARRNEVIAEIEINGFNAINTKDIKNTIHKYDIIFNTIPSRIINKEQLSNVSDNALIIDLASKPGGVDFSQAKLLNKQVIWALSLPGKVAPVTAGKIIKETITNILTELGV